jgi:serine protease AprX
VKECDFGHGTAMAGVIAGKGNGSPNSDKNYRGVATGAKVIDVKVSDCKGQGRISQVIEGLQWVLENQKKYKIRIVNISLNAEKSESYHNSPLAAAVEVLWFNKIVVIVSAGNVADGNLYPPANDPFVITVGALDEKGTQSLADDVVASFSGYGATSDGVQKPDLVAPGVNIVATQMKNSYLWQNHPRNVVSGKDEKNNYIRMSGTSMAAAIVSGAVAILLKVEPNLTPDQVKYRLKATARPIGNGVRDGAGSLDLYKAINTKTTASANTGTPVSRLLASSMQNIGPSVSWNSVSWNSVSWNSVSWNSVSWNSVSWNSLSQDSVTWNSTVWE